MILRFNTA